MAVDPQSIFEAIPEEQTEVYLNCLLTVFHKVVVVFFCSGA